MVKSVPAVPEALQQRRELVARATAGDRDAQSAMGDRCREGDEFAPQDFAEAMRWYRLAADQGDANAQNNIGAMYEHGMGVPVDTAQAAKWYRLPADQGFATAQFNLALLFGWGVGVPMDEPEATRLLHKAAAQGHIEACSVLGTLYRFGDGVERRIPLAAEFHVIAALEGDAAALASLAEYHDEIETEALSGRMLAALCLAKMYDRGLGVKADKASMFAWLLWGHNFCNRKEDPDVAEELDEMREFYAMVISDADTKKAKRKVTRMSTANPGRGKAKSKAPQATRELKLQGRRVKAKSFPVKPESNGQSPDNPLTTPIVDLTDQDPGSGVILGSGGNLDTKKPVQKGVPEDDWNDFMDRLGDSNMGDPNAPLDELVMEVMCDRGVTPEQLKGATEEERAHYAAFCATYKAAKGGN